MSNNLINYRPWGYYEILSGNDNSGYKVKKITILPKKRISLQSHNNRCEHWVIISGIVKVNIDGINYDGSTNSYFYIPRNSIHRIENIGDYDAIFIETQTGNYLGEDDIHRFQDDYGRI
jgi:mannose-6-phosphate isomerase-like protein (cupin superfamily)